MQIFIFAQLHKVSNLSYIVAYMKKSMYSFDKICSLSLKIIRLHDFENKVDAFTWQINILF